MAKQPRVAVVTGTNSGVGLSLDVLLAEDGFQLMLQSPKRVSTSLVEAIEHGVNSDESVTQAFEAILQKTGRVDVLVNNAALLSSSACVRYRHSSTRVRCDSMSHGRPGNHASATLRQDHQHQPGGRRLGPTVQGCDLRLQFRD